MGVPGRVERGVKRPDLRYPVTRSLTCARVDGKGAGTFGAALLPGAGPCHGSADEDACDSRIARFHPHMPLCEAARAGREEKRKMPRLPLGEPFGVAESLRKLQPWC